MPDSEKSTPVHREVVSSLPIIDIGPFMRASSEEERRAVARALRKACIDIGFFYLSGHGMAQAELDEALDFAQRLFALPLELKMTLHASKSPGRRGFVQIGGIDPSRNQGKAPDLKERFSLSRELIPGEPEQGRYDAGQSQWPGHDLLPGFEPFMKAHIQKRVEIARNLVRAFALSLDLPESYFDETYRYLGASLLMNYYPPVTPQPGETGQWSFSPHADYGGFTILLQDSLGGLEAHNAAGEWIAVPPVAGTFVINIGDMFAMWTNDLYASSLHRAMNTASVPRVSLPLFTYPHGSTLIRCLPSCQGPGNPARYPPVRAEDYNRALVERSSQTGQPGISARTAERLEVY